LSLREGIESVWRDRQGPGCEGLCGGIFQRAGEPMIVLIRGITQFVLFDGAETRWMRRK
jgi:hypothetical protein